MARAQANIFPTLDPAGRWIYVPECDHCRWRGAGSHDQATARATAKAHNTDVHGRGKTLNQQVRF